MLLTLFIIFKFRLRWVAGILIEKERPPQPSGPKRLLLVDYGNILPFSAESYYQSGMSVGKEVVILFWILVG